MCICHAAVIPLSEIVFFRNQLVVRSTSLKNASYARDYASYYATLWRPVGSEALKRKDSYRDAENTRHTLWRFAAQRVTKCSVLKARCGSGLFTQGGAGLQIECKALYSAACAAPYCH